MNKIINYINSKLDILIKILNKNKYTKIIVDILIDWKIPYFNLIKKYLVYISIVSIIIFIEPKMYKDFWEWAMNLLLIILFISPASKIFPKFKFLNKLLILRRPVWIIIWFFVLAHTIWFFILKNVDIINFLQNEIINYKNQLFWWIWWTIFMLFPFITSNNLSQKILKNKWKIFQQLTYFFFIFWSIHIFLIKWHIGKIVIIFIWLVLKFLAHKKVVILK